MASKPNYVLPQYVTDSMQPRWVLVQWRETNEWTVVGHTDRSPRKYRPSGLSRGAYFHYGAYSSTLWKKPESTSPYVRAHKIVIANTKQEAENRCQILNSSSR